MEEPLESHPAPSEPAPRLFTVTLDRRRFLVVLGGVAALSALRPPMAWARRLERGLPPLQPWTLPQEAPTDPIGLARALIGSAVLAPSHWNSQPWRFEVETTSLRLVADTRRALPVTDPDRRGMMLSLGAALENLLVAARAWGLRPSVTYLPHGGEGDVVAEVSWAPGDGQRRDRGLFAAIPRRRTNRRTYDTRGIYMQNRAQLDAQMSEGLSIKWIDDHGQIRRIAEVAHDATRDQMRDPRAEREQYGWMRFGDGDSRRHGDGVSVEALELGGPAKWFAGRYFDPDSWFLRFGADSYAKQTRDAVRSSGALALLCASGTGDAAWLMAGQAYERVALKATQLGISQQPLSAPIERAGPRAELARRFGVDEEQPLMLLRVGHARKPDPSPRRAVAVVSTFRNS